MTDYITARVRVAQAIFNLSTAIQNYGATLPADVAQFVAAYATQPDSSLAPEWFIDVPDGIMVCFYLDRALASKLALPGGEPPEDLHITLALPGKISELSKDELERLPSIIKGFALISRPLSGTITGPAEFAAHEGKKPVVLLVDIPGLPAWRQRLVEILALNGYKVANDHGYIPHITLRYTDESEDVSLDFSPLPIELEKITLDIGGEKKNYKLGGAEVDEALDAFAARPRGAGKPGARAKEVAAVNSYQVKLEAAYRKWADDLADELEDADNDDERDELIAAALLALLAFLRKLGRDNLPEAVSLGLGGKTPSAKVYALLAQEIEENDAYLETTFIPDIERKLKTGIRDADIIAAIAAGAGAEAIGGLLSTFGGRVSSSAGNFWDTYNKTTGLTAQESEQKVYWHRDDNAKHCDSCLEYGDKEYDSYDEMLAQTGGVSPANGTECGNNCRCWLEMVED